jgi:hypothetical protein
MARRPNYGAEKRQKELQRQKKREEKVEKKRLKKEGAAKPDPGEGVESGAEAADTAGVAPESDVRGRDADAAGRAAEDT